MANLPGDETLLLLAAAGAMGLADDTRFLARP
jgi:hypothetical protein